MSDSVRLFPLSSRQLRLRSVTEVTLFKPVQAKAGKSTEFSISFHQSAHSLPFYSSPPARLSGGRAVFPVAHHDHGGSRCVVVKVWCGERGGTVWGINLAGLISLGEHLSPHHLAPRLQPNTLVFTIHSHSYISQDCLIEPLIPSPKTFPEIPDCRLLEMKDCKISSSAHQLIKMNRKHRELREIQTKNDFIKKDILQKFGQSIDMEKWKETKRLDRKTRVDCLRREILRVEAERRDKEKSKMEMIERVKNMKKSLQEKYENLDKEREGLKSLLEIVSQLRIMIQ